MIRRMGRDDVEAVGQVWLAASLEAHDFVPDKQTGVARKHPEYAYDLPVAFPLSARERERLAAAGLDTEFNAFCRGKPLQACYGKPYWDEQDRG